MHPTTILRVAPPDLIDPHCQGAIAPLRWAGQTKFRLGQHVCVHSTKSRATMTVYPRQRLYDIDHKGYSAARSSGKLNDGDDADFVSAFSDFIGSETPVLPLARGRLSLYFATRRHATPEKNEVVMCPFTIFDLVNMAVCGGGRPRWVDSEPGTPHVSLRQLQQTVNEKTALVVITHYHTVNPEIAQIASWLRSIGVPLLEDCAISLGGRVEGQHVGTFGDYGLFSFGLFKFIATYFGGAVWVRDDAERAEIQATIESWPKMTAKDIAPYRKKGVKFTTLTDMTVFNWFTFPAFRFGYLNNIQFIKKNAVNDPSPMLVKDLPDAYQRRPSDYQVRDWRRQLDGVLGLSRSAAGQR